MHRWKRPRMRCSRLHVYSTDPERALGDLWIEIFGKSWSRTAKDLAYMYAPMEAAARAVWALAHVYYRPKATPGRPLDHGLTGFHRRGRHGGTVNIAN